MFAPTQLDVRRFFCEVYRKQTTSVPLTQIEAIAANWVSQHPEYFDELTDLQSALAANYTLENGRNNPFLHLSMHLTITEQISIDQPQGIRHAFEALQRKLGSAHAAHHEVMECLGEMIWVSQRSGLAPDGEQYLECLRRNTNV
jgi:hypothetical protein